MSANTTCDLDFCVAAAAMAKPWETIDGESYDQDAINSREQFETSSRLSPSRYDDAEMYFLEFCKALLIIKERVPKDIEMSGLMPICMDEYYTLHLVKEHLRAVAHGLRPEGRGNGMDTLDLSVMLLGNK
ncbi:hypothetical protein EMPG_09349 [Blastomyces silverae]|uniref:Uncharacterized protein n=1 Tax=Blastomyces silverae TaxID=2060906 RepID=A0A0H1B2H8_9EURO|nr:hypothetical protein EMPG_09349 [Blastomyces silverae]